MLMWNSESLPDLGNNSSCKSGNFQFFVLKQTEIFKYQSLLVKRNTNYWASIYIHFLLLLQKVYQSDRLDTFKHKNILYWDRIL